MSPQSTATMLTSLLNSLHTHLQIQTQLLPTLYAQLGLPTTALEDELKALQQQLVHNIEVQIDRRRKEVDEWVEKCEVIEKQCVRYTKALGGNIKATGSSLGELRKEQALPRRYEMIAEYQEKLRQVYHTKLEQLNTLTSRINALTRTLGPNYFALDILEPTVSPGEDPHDPNASRDITPERFMKLEKELVRGKAEVNKRLNQLSQTFIQIDWLYTELGMSPPSLDDLPTSPNFGSTISTLSYLPSSSTSSQDPFAMSTPTPASRSTSMASLLLQDIPVAPEVEYQRILTNFITKIEEIDTEALPENQNIPVGLENVDPTPGLVSWANGLGLSLEDTKRRREAHIQAMYDQLEGLWRRMGVSDSQMDAFVETHKGSTQETVQEYEEELERMLELKRSRMGSFVENAREEILKLWDDLMVGDEERADFAPFADDEYTEELLTIHEDEIKRLKEEKRMKAPLLANIKKYFEICEEEKELASAASDQSRLTGRGPRDPGRLLREEKMRKRVQKEKPRLESDLLSAIPAWEEQAGMQFLVLGEPFLQILMETVTVPDPKNEKKQPRAGSVPPRSRTPVENNRGYMPQAKTGVVTPAVRQAPPSSSHTMPNKRQKLADSTPSYGSTTRAPLGTYRGGNQASGNARSVSPTKIPSKTPSSLTRSGATIGMVVPKPGTQHHALGHGRVPSSVIYGAGVGHGAYPPSSTMRSTSTSSIQSRYPSGAYRSGAAKQSTRAKRESFRPRPSIDAVEQRTLTVGGAGGARWNSGFTVKEEDEGF